MSVERCTTTNVNLIEQSNLEDRLYPFRKIEKMDHMDLLVQKIQEYLKNEKIENNFCADEIVNCKESEE